MNPIGGHRNESVPNLDEVCLESISGNIYNEWNELPIEELVDYSTAGQVGADCLLLEPETLV